MKRLIKSALRRLGFEVRRLRPPDPGHRPLGEIHSFLAGVKIRGFAPSGILDVGANRGDWTRMAQRFFPGVPTIMIEPQDEMETRLRALATELPHCRYIKAGAGKEAGELAQTIWDDLNGSSFLPAVDSAKVATGKQRLTRILTIDSILQQPEHRDFKAELVKLDIQGFELEALKGGNSLFGTTELFVVETSLFPFMSPAQPVARDVIAFMAERDYEIYDITGYLNRPHDDALGQMDLAFAKRDGRLRRSNEW